MGKVKWKVSMTMMHLFNVYTNTIYITTTFMNIDMYLRFTLKSGMSSLNQIY